MKPGRISASEFARRVGVSAPAVTKALTKGRITGEKANGKWYLDPETAAREWSEKSRYRIESSGTRELAKTIDAAPARSIKDSRALREDYEARFAQLKYETLSGELVKADEVQAAWSSVIAMARTRILAVPTRAKIRMQDLTAAQVEMLEELIREALEDLSAEEGDEDDSS